MAEEGFAAEMIIQQRSLDMRYVGQSHELTIPYDDNDVVQAFHAAHGQRYGYERTDTRVEIVTLRLSAAVSVEPPQFEALVPGSGHIDTAVIGKKQVWFGGDMVFTNLYDRGKLQPGQRFSGPAVVFQYDTTTVIPPEWQAAVDDFGNIILSDSNHSPHAVM
jgi:N-methylhydantoinase A